jgi:hypothetical protein
MAAAGELTIAVSNNKAVAQSAARIERDLSVKFGQMDTSIDYIRSGRRIPSWQPGESMTINDFIECWQVVSHR